MWKETYRCWSLLSHIVYMNKNDGMCCMWDIGNVIHLWFHLKMWKLIRPSGISSFTLHITLSILWEWRSKKDDQREVKNETFNSQFPLLILFIYPSNIHIDLLLIAYFSTSMKIKVLKRDPLHRMDSLIESVDFSFTIRFCNLN